MTITSALWDVLGVALGAVGVTVIVWVFADGIAGVLVRAFR